MARCRDGELSFSVFAKRTHLIFSIAIVLVTACAQTSIRPLARTAAWNLPPPSRILVYNFAVSGADVTEYQGIMRQQPSTRDPLERQREIGRNVSEILGVNLAHGLGQLGLVVERAKRSKPIGENDLIIDGWFVSVDEGNPLRRWVIGFGSGASKLETRVRVLRGDKLRTLLEFATRADSGKLPGAVATAPVGAAAPSAVGVALAAGTAAHAGLGSRSSEVDRMAAASADQAVRYLSEFFAMQGWIGAGQVKKARFAH